MRKVIVSLFLSIIIVGLVYLLGISLFNFNDRIKDMYVEVTILDNGDVTVEKVISYATKNNKIKINYEKYKEKFDSSNIEKYNKSDIYNYDDIDLIEISKVNKFSKNIDSLEKLDINYKNKSDKLIVEDKLIYIKYNIKNYSVLHNDLGEVIYRIVEDEKVDNLEVIINIPNNNAKLEYYLHGSSNANIENINNNKVKIVGKYVNDYLDVRILFDRNVIKNSKKNTNVDSASSIIALEKEIDKEYRYNQKLNNYKGIIGIILDTIKTIWLAITIFMLMRTYLKYDKEYKRKFKKEILKEKPSNIEPYELEFLNYGNITQDSVKSAILKMVKEDKLIIKQNNNSYLLKRTDKELTDEENYLCTLFFKSGVIDIKDLSTKDYETFSEFTYDKLIDRYYKNSISKRYFEDESELKRKLVMYSLLGLVLNMVSYLATYNEVIMITIYLVSITTMIYFLGFRKKTKKGNEELAKWEAYKKYLLNNEIKDNYMDAIIYSSSLGIKNKIRCSEKDNFIDFSYKLLNKNILHK